MEYRGSSEAIEFWSYLKEESPRGAALVVAAYFDEKLAELVDPAEKKTFDDRIKSALEQSFICAYESEDLHIIRKLRNLFVHDLREKDFDEEKAKQVNTMQTWTKASNACLADTEDFPTAKDRLFYVAFVLHYRLKKRSDETVPPDFDPEFEVESWPMVASV